MIEQRHSDMRPDTLRTTDPSLDEARLRQQEQGLRNLDWHVGNAVPLPFADGAFSLVVTDKLPERQKLALTTAEYIARRVEIDYGTYLRFRHNIAMR